MEEGSRMVGHSFPNLMHLRTISVILCIFGIVPFIPYILVVAPLQGMKRQTVAATKPSDINSSGQRIPWALRNKFPRGMLPDILQLERPKYIDALKNPCWLDETKTGMKLRCFPYFFIAGMNKCGTTDLWKMLKQHPQIFNGSLKETHWWAIQRYGKKIHVEDYSTYFDDLAADLQSKLFKKGPGRGLLTVTVDSSPNTLWRNDNWTRIPQNANSTIKPKIGNSQLIWNLLPMAKIIVSLRNPVDRLYSGYLFYNRKQQKSPQDFHKKCLKGISDWKKCVKRYSMRYCAYDREAYHPKVRFYVSMYSIYIRDWLQVFPRNQLYISRLEEYSENRAKVLNEIYTFLDLEPFTIDGAVNELEATNRRRPQFAHVKGMFNKTRVMLNTFFRPFNVELTKLLHDESFLHLWN